LRVESGVAGSSGIAGTSAVGTGGFGDGMTPAEGWVDRTPAVLPAAWPSPRRSPAMVADDEAKQVVLYGGYANALPVQDTWTWNGSSGVWTQFPVKPPGVFDQAAIAYDGRRNEILLFSGESYPSAAPSNGLWLWPFGTEAWIPQLVPSGAVPAPCNNASAAYDYSHDFFIVHGCDDHPQDVWEWTVGTNTWAAPSDTASMQAPTGPGAFAWDPRRSLAVYFGGAAGNELWQWNTAGAWTQVAQTKDAWPSPRIFPSLVLDRDRGAMMLFGGSGYPNGPALNDLWQWYPDTGWKLLDNGKSGHAPPPRYMFGMTYDVSIARLVVFGGGQSNGDDLGDVWTYQAGP
jgi:hypothetical protein